MIRGARCEICQEWSLRALRQKERKKAALCSSCARGQRPEPEPVQQAKARGVQPARVIPLTAVQLIEEWGRS